MSTPTMETEMKNEIDLSDLPKNKANQIIWKQSVEHVVKFIYNNISGEFTITKFIEGESKGKHHVEVLYNNETYVFPVESIRNCKLQQLTGKKLGSFNCNIGDILQLRHQKGEVIDQFRERDKSGGLHKMLKMRCCDCGREWSAQEQSLLKGGTKGIQGCPYCNWMGKFEEGFNDIPTTDPWMVPFFQGGEEEAKQYSHYMTKRLIFKCPDCGKLNDHPIGINTLYMTHSIQCSCQDKGGSISENMMSDLLNQFNIEYNREAGKSVFDWVIDKRRYDFYLPKYNAIIELHGKQHYQKVNWNDNRSLEDRKDNDEIKRKSALQNGIKYYFIVNCSNVLYDSHRFISQCEEAGLLSFLNIDKDNIKYETLFKRKSVMDQINILVQYIEEHPDARRKEIMQDLNLDKHKYARYMNSLTTKPSWYKGGFTIEKKL